MKTILRAKLTTAGMLLILCSFAGNPKIDSAQWNDLNLDGYIDQVVLYFDSVVAVTDIGATDGLDCIQLRNGTTLINIDGADYSHTNTNILALNFRNDSVYGTGIYGLSVKYTRAGGSTIVDTTTTSVLLDGTGPALYSDKAQPVAMEAYYRDGFPYEEDMASSETPDGVLDNFLIKFSEEIAVATYDKDDITVILSGDIDLKSESGSGWTFDGIMEDRTKLRWNNIENDVKDSILSSANPVAIYYKTGNNQIADESNNFWAETKNDTILVSDAAAPYIDTVKFYPGDGNTVGIDSIVTVRVRVFGNDISTLSATVFQVNGQDVRSTFTSLGNNYYEVKYTVTESDDSIHDATEAIPIEIILTDTAGNACQSYTNSYPENTPGIDNTRPVINGVLFPDNPMNIGDTVTVSISVDDDNGDMPSLTSGSIGGYPLILFDSSSSPVYTAKFVITAGGNNYPAYSDIPVSNLMLTDNAGNNSTVFSAYISRSNDPIDAKAPAIVDVSVVNDTMLVGDQVEATITVQDDGGDFPTLLLGKLAGYPLTNLVRENKTTYKAYFSINNFGADFAASDTLFVENMVLEDTAGNQCTPFADTIVQNNDLIDANLPFVDTVFISNNSMRSGETILATIQVTDDKGDFPELVAGTIGGYNLFNLTKVSNTVYNAQFTITEGGNDYAGNENISVDNLRLKDKAGNLSYTYSDFIVQSNDTLDANSPEIIDVSIPNDTMVVGNIVPATITVEADATDTFVLQSGTIAGFTLENLIKVNASNYTATFIVTNGGTDIPPSSDIPVSNLVLSDRLDNVSNTYAENINQDNDFLDANKPEIKGFTPPDAMAVIGDTVTALIQVINDNGDFPQLVSGTYGGYPLTNLTYVDPFTYNVDFIISEGGNSFGGGDNISLNNLRLKDNAGNYSVPYDTIISQLNDPVYASRPTASISGDADICEGDSTLITVELTGVPPWNLEITEGSSVLTFNSINASPFTFYTDSAGTYSITGITDQPGNAGTITDTSVTITVYPLPSVTFNLDPTYNVNDNPVTITNGTPKGGIYSGPGITVSDSTFHPNIAGTLNSPHAIKYTYTDANGCTNFHIDTVSVVEVGAYFSSLESFYCVDGVTDQIFVRNLPSNADSISFQIAGGVGLDTAGMNDTTAVLDPSVIGYGADTVIFNYYADAWFSISRSFKVDSVGADIDFITLDSSYCAGDADVILNAINLFPSGGTGHFSGPANGFFTETHSNSARFYPSVADPDSSYTISYYYEAPESHCQSPLISRTTRLNDLPRVSFTLKSNYNVDGGPVALIGNHSPAGTFSGPGVSDNELRPGNAGVQTGISIKYYYADSLTGCSNDTTNTTDIRKADVAILGLQDVICYDSSVVYGVTVDKKSYTGGRFFGTGIDSVDVDTATFTPAKVGRGYDTVVYRYYDDSTLYQVSRIVYVDSIGEISFTDINTAYCSDASEIKLQGTNDHPDGFGNFSFSGSAIGGFTNDGNSATLVPSAALADSLPYQLTYTYTSNYSGSCVSSLTKELYIHPIPSVSFHLKSNYNVAGAPVELKGNHYPYGDFSGGGVTNNIFYPNLVTPISSHPIKYAYTDTITGCSNDTTLTTAVKQANVSILGLSSVYCYDSIPDTVTVSSHSFTNGRFIGQGIDSVGIDTAVFIPSLAGDGFDTIIYSYFDDSTLYKVSKVVRVDSLGPPQISNLAPEYCAGDAQVTMNGSLLHSNGYGTFTFSEPTPLFQNLGNTATLDPKFSLADTVPYTVTFTYTSNISGCTRSLSKTTQIHELPYVEFNLLSNYNVETERVDLIGNYAGGTFNGPGVFQDELGDYYFSPKQAKAGDNYSISYGYTDTNGCYNDTTRLTNVSAVDADFYGIDINNNYCIDGMVDTIYTIAYNSNGVPGSFSGEGITDLGNDTVLFNPVVAGKGDHVLTYTYTGDDNVTIYTIQELLSVDSIGEVKIIGIDSAYCEDAAEFIVESSVNHPDGEGEFFGPASGFFATAEQARIVPSQVGASDSAYRIDYVYTAQSGCQSSISRQFFIHGVPQLSYAIKDLYSAAEPADTLQGNPYGGYFTGKGIVNDTIFRPDIADVGNWTVTYHYTDSNGCYSAESHPVEVQEAVGSISYRESDNIYCYYSEIDTLVANPLNSNGAPGWFAGKGITETGRDTAIFDPVQAGDGTHSIQYYYYGTDSLTIFSFNLEFTVDSIGHVDFSGLEPAYCEDYSQVTLTPQIPSGGTGSFVTQSGLYNSANVGYLYPDEMKPDSTYEIEYIFTSSLSGCTKSIKKQVHIHSLPELYFSVLDVYNVDSDPVLFSGQPGGSAGLFEPLSVMTNNGDGTAYFNPDAAGVGNHTIYYSFTDSNGCSNNYSKQVEVQSSAGSITAIDADNIYCYDAINDTLYARPVNSDSTYGRFSGPGVSDLGNNRALFDPSAAGNGKHTIIFEYKGEGGSTNFYLYKELTVDSVGQVDFIGLSPDFCKNDKQVKLTPISTPSGGTEVFYGNGVLGDIYIPSNAPAGYDTVSYVFTRNYSLCTARKDSIISIHEVPDIYFEITDECIAEVDDSTEFINLTHSTDSVVSWSWNFDDVASGVLNTSSLKEPFHLYTAPGTKTVTLEAVTTFGCISSYDSIINLGTKSLADFIWLSECFGNEPIQFLADDDDGNISDFTWNFGDGSSELSVADTLTSHLFSQPGSYQVKLAVSSVFGCTDSVVKNVPIRPYVYFDALEGNTYYQDFENGGNGWVSEAEKKHGLNTWKLGAPAGSIINTVSTNGGSIIWYTDVNYPNHKSEKSYVTSPCFDFTTLNRPMIKLDIWKASDQYRDGANIQYTTNGGNTWNNIGTTDDGINWYDYTRIAGEPGGEREGWSVSSPDTTWRESRNNLDEIAGQDNIQFRIAYGSDGNEVDPFEGFAFDNIWIGDRSRKAVIEHFTNSKVAEARNADVNYVYPTAKSQHKDIVDIHYHTAFPEANMLNEDFPAGPAARTAFYGISTVPYSILDGNFSKYNYQENSLNLLDIRKRILMDPWFKIEPVIEVLDGVVKTETKITSLVELPEEDLSLYTLVVERSVSAEKWGGTANDMYKNIVKRILPDAEGERIIGSWKAGDSAKFVGAWEMENVYNSDSLLAVVFVQNNQTKEIYQSAFALSGVVDTIIDTQNEWADVSGVDFILFPNPASDRLNILFETRIQQKITVQIYNNLGEIVLNSELSGISQRKEVSLHSLTDGIYFARILSDKELIGTKKFFILNK